jgi:molecular chaperone GrpE
MFKKEDEEKNNPFKDENFTEETAEEKPENNEETPVEAPETAKEETPGGKEAALQAELDSLNNKYLRLAADFDNFRKRQMQERESLLKYGAEDTLKKIITVLDTFERAKKSVADMSECDKVKESYDVGIKQLYDTLDKIGLKKIEAKGEEFDPNIHEAVMQTPTNDYPSNTVIDELQTGYKLFDKVLRPTFVNVATEAPEEQNNEQKEE